jgi:hypothetical protein
MDIGSITAAYNSLKFGKDLLSTMAEAKVDIASQGKVLEALAKLGQVQDTLFELREELFRLQSDNESLRKKLGEVEGWGSNLNEYDLTKTNGGAVVYVSKGEPQHFLCPSCIATHQIQILQDNRTSSGKFRCPGCKNEFPVNPRKEHPTYTASRDYDPFNR